MANRADLVLGFLLVAGVAIVWLVAFVIGPLSPWLSLPELVIFVYAAYWAFDIRRGLAVRLYRDQALGIGLIIVIFGAFYANAWWFFGATQTNLALSVLQQTAGFGLSLSVFYWLDASILASRRSDPLLRDTLHWKRVRYILWPLVWLGPILVSWSVIAYPPTSYPSGLPISGSVVAIGTILSYFSLIAPFVIGAVLLPIVGRRSRDSSLRRHLVWFGLFAATFTFVFTRNLVPSLVNDLDLTLTGSVILAIATYCLYRSARSLVPLNKLSLSAST
jgi:hypothetical protein